MLARISEHGATLARICDHVRLGGSHQAGLNHERKLGAHGLGLLATVTSRHDDGADEHRDEEHHVDEDHRRQLAVDAQPHGTCHQSRTAVPQTMHQAGDEITQNDPPESALVAPGPDADRRRGGVERVAEDTEPGAHQGHDDDVSRPLSSREISQVLHEGEAQGAHPGVEDVVGKRGELQLAQSSDEQHEDRGLGELLDEWRDDGGGAEFAGRNGCLDEHGEDDGC